MWRLRILTEEECIIGQASLVAVRDNTPLRPNRAGSSPVVRLVLLALKTKAGLRLRRMSLATVLAPPKSAKKGEGDGRCDRWSRRRRPAEIRKGTDYIEITAFTGDFIECHGGLLLLGVGSSENFSDDLTGALELGKAYVYSASLMFIFPGEIPSSDSTKSSPSSSTINEFPVLNIKLYNPS